MRKRKASSIVFGRRILCAGERDLAELAEKFSSLLSNGDVCLLFGEMGSGKTAFAQGVFLALGGDGRLFSSPTFSLVNTYPLPGCAMHHVDLYRLAGIHDHDDLSQESWLSPKGAFSFVEWAERLGGWEPGQGYKIEFFHHEKGRQVEIRRLGAK